MARGTYDRAVLQPDFPIETERLTLRPFRESDFDDLYAIQSRADVTRFLYWGVRSPDEVRDAVRVKAGMTALKDEGEGLSIAVVWREIGRVVGDVSLNWHSREHRCAEIGFVFNPEFHGKGLAREASEAVLRLAFEDFGLHRAIGRLDARNDPSARLLERLGMRREAHFVDNEYVKGEWASEAVYAILDREWRER